MNDILSIFDKIDTTYVMKKYKVGQLNKAQNKIENTRIQLLYLLII